jgi:hypothetical protein
MRFIHRGSIFILLVGGNSQINPASAPFPSFTLMAAGTDTGSNSDRFSDKEASYGDVKKEHAIYNAHIDCSHIDEKALIRKIDFALIPWLSLLYLLSFLDRTSIGK